MVQRIMRRIVPPDRPRSCRIPGSGWARRRRPRGVSLASMIVAMERTLTDIAGIALLAASIVLSAFWIRSHWRSDTICHQATPQAWSVASNNGGVTVGRRTYDGLLLDADWSYRSAVS